MIDNIKNILSTIDVDGWKIIETKTKSTELFFVKKELDMNRGKDVHHIKVFVYKDFVEDNTKYKGSSSTNISPTMDDTEIKEKLEDAAFAATFVKNEYYPLVKPVDMDVKNMNSTSSPISEWVNGLVDGIFKYDTLEKGSINSSELFINDVSTRIVNSEGVDVSYEGYEGQLEFITNWTEDGEEIELYRDIKFSDYNPDYLSEEVNHMLNMSKEKAMATNTPNLEKQTILLTGEPVKEFFNYYYQRANTRAIYEQISTEKLNESIQGDSINGDLVTIKLDPVMNNSSKSKPYDNDGLPLKEVTIIKDGILKSYWGNTRFSSYLDIEPTGDIENIVVEGGSKSVEDFKKEPYLELLAFSDFQVNPITGDFAGEIRLGRYFDGEKTIPVSSGSISGNIKEVQKNMYLSKEINQDNNFIGPKTIQLFDIDISGS